MALDNSLVDLKTLAKALNLPASWLRAETDAGRLPCLRVGRRTLYNVTAVQEYLMRRAACDPGVERPSQPAIPQTYESEVDDTTAQ